jgi:hypothetical protein
VISVGNAVTLLQPAQIEVAVAQMRAVCRDGATLVLAVRDFRERIKSRVWRDDPLAKVTARFLYERPNEVTYVIDVQDASGARSHELVLHPIGLLELAGAAEAAGFRVTRSDHRGGRAIVAGTAR